MQEKAFGKDRETASATQPTQKSWRAAATDWGLWILQRLRGKVLFSIAALALLFLLLSRPMFYVVLARTISVSVRLLLRRSIGLVVVLMDSLLDEAAYSLETHFIAPPPTNVDGVSRGNAASHTYNDREIQPQHPFVTLLLHGLIAFAGALIGRHWPRPAPAFRHPTHLRVV